MMHYFAIWMAVGAIVVLPFLSKDFIIELYHRAKYALTRDYPHRRFNMLLIMTGATLLVIILWPLIIVTTVHDIIFFDDDEL